MHRRTTVIDGDLEIGRLHQRKQVTQLFELTKDFRNCNFKGLFHTPGLRFGTTIGGEIFDLEKICFVLVIKMIIIIIIFIIIIITIIWSTLYPQSQHRRTVKNIQCRTQHKKADQTCSITQMKSIHSGCLPQQFLIVILLISILSVG